MDLKNSEKRILVLNYEFPPLGGGASPVSYELAKGYVKLGNEVSIITMGYKDLSDFEVKDGINIYRVKCLRSKKEICHPWEQLTYIISAKRFLKKHLQENKYDICHCHFIIPVGVVALWAKKRFGLEYIVTAHGSDVPGYNTDRFKLLHKFTGSIIKKVCSEAKKIVSPSIFLKKLILSNVDKNLEEKIIHIPNGIDRDKFIPQKKEKIIFSSGRLLERKGFQYLIKAVSDKDIGYDVHIAGDGPMMSKLKALAEKSKTKIVFHGWINNSGKEYKNLLESSEIFVLMSEKENFSIALLEAMSAGCAVITTNVSGCPESIGDSGLLVEPRNYKDLREKINFLISDNVKMDELKRKGRERILRKYDWGIIINEYINLLK